VKKELKGNIAIVDDDVLARQVRGDYMESAGYAVDSFGSAEQSLASASYQRSAA